MIKCFDCKKRVRITSLVLRNGEKIHLCTDCYYGTAKVGA
jgi:hypothetical protein